MKNESFCSCVCLRVSVPLWPRRACRCRRAPGLCSGTAASCPAAAAAAPAAAAAATPGTLAPAAAASAAARPAAAPLSASSCTPASQTEQRTDGRSNTGHKKGVHVQKKKGRVEQPSKIYLFRLSTQSFKYCSLWFICPFKENITSATVCLQDTKATDQFWKRNHLSFSLRLLTNKDFSPIFFKFEQFHATHNQHWLFTWDM